jgi:hypothetical protein
LSALTLADSDKLRVGDFVVAVGNPFGLGQTVTSGIVSALGRTGLGIEGYEDFIQTDASINPGNSGGALVNLRGELVGINTAILSRTGGNVGIGFAIPINMARQVMAQLVEHGEVKRGQLGASAQDLTPELASAFGIADQRGAGNGEVRTLRANVAEPRVTTLEGERIHARLAGAQLGDIVEGMPLHGKIEGVLLIDVIPGSPAWAAGLRQGDVIISNVATAPCSWCCAEAFLGAWHPGGADYGHVTGYRDVTYAVHVETSSDMSGPRVLKPVRHAPAESEIGAVVVGVAPRCTSWAASFRACTSFITPSEYRYWATQERSGVERYS